VWEIAMLDISEMGKEQSDAFGIRINQSQRDGSWDEPALAALLQEVAASDDVALSSTGFDADELDDLLRDLGQLGEPPADPGAQVDRAAELQEKWQVKRGDVWEIGQHVIMCGDSSTSKDTDELLFRCEDSVVLCHADPPYGMGKEKDGIINDNLYKEKLDEFQMAWWDSCRTHLEHNASVYIWGNAEDLWRLWYCGGLRDSERLTVRNEIVWDKGDSGVGKVSLQGYAGLRSYAPGSERCLFFMLGEQQMSTNADNYWDGWENIRLYLKQQKELMGWDIATCKRLAGHSETSGCHWFDKSQWTMPTREVYKSWQREARGDGFKCDYDEIKREWLSTRAYFDNTHDNMTDVWQFPRVQGDDRWGHATPKPVEMIRRIITSSSQHGDIVYIPFTGSGSALVACEQTGRVGYGMEIAPEYVSVTLERLAGMGLQPTRAG
jgi:DNA modification methylase